MFQTRIDIPGKLAGYDAARAYFAAFRIVTRRPEPAAIKPCTL